MSPTAQPRQHTDQFTNTSDLRPQTDWQQSSEISSLLQLLSWLAVVSLSLQCYLCPHVVTVRYQPRWSQCHTRVLSLYKISNELQLQELQNLIDEANQSLEESGTPSHEIMVIVLHREFSGGTIGITLAGGADYESKEITVS